MPPRTRATVMLAALTVFLALALYKVGRHHYGAALAFSGLALAQLAVLLDDRRGPRELIPPRLRIATVRARRRYLGGIAVTVAGLVLALLLRETA
jgi:hypothetical protein